LTSNELTICSRSGNEFVFYSKYKLEQLISKNEELEEKNKILTTSSGRAIKDLMEENKQLKLKVQDLELKLAELSLSNGNMSSGI
jgi:hypothetical protein